MRFGAGRDAFALDTVVVCSGEEERAERKGGVDRVEWTCGAERVERSEWGVTVERKGGVEG